MATSHWCTALAYDVICIINAYLNACIKASATAAPSDPGGRTPESFHFTIDELDHGRYHGRPLQPSLRQILLAWDNKRAAVASIPRQPPPPTAVSELAKEVPRRQEEEETTSSPQLHVGAHRKEIW